METQLKKIDEAANNYNKTKDPQYKDLWYNLIREWKKGNNNFKRPAVTNNSMLKHKERHL